MRQQPAAVTPEAQERALPLRTETRSCRGTGQRTTRSESEKCGVSGSLLTLYVSTIHFWQAGLPESVTRNQSASLWESLPACSANKEVGIRDITYKTSVNANAQKCFPEPKPPLISAVTNLEFPNLGAVQFSCNIRFTLELWLITDPRKSTGLTAWALHLIPGTA